MTDPLDLDAITSRVDACLPGPWTAEPAPDGHISVGMDDDSGMGHIATIATYLHADADFIAHARQDVPVLVAEVRWLRDQLDRLATDASASDQTARDLRSAVTNALGVDYDTRVDSIASRITDLVADTTEENQ
jgi:hypothetical protein